MRGTDRNLANVVKRSPVKPTDLKTSFQTWITDRVCAILETICLPRYFAGYAVIFFNRACVGADRSLDDAREQDVVLLSNTLTTVGFIVTTCTDLTVSEMRRTVKKFARMSHRQANYFFCAIISHGDEDDHLAYGRDGQIPIDILLEPLMISRKFRDKELLLVLELCRGGIFLDTNSKRSPDCRSESPRYDRWRNYYTMAMAATLNPDSEWRAANLGSCFIQSMCRLWLATGGSEITSFGDLHTRVRFDLSTNPVNHVNAPQNARSYLFGGYKCVRAPIPVTRSRGSCGRDFPNNCRKSSRR